MFVVAHRRWEGFVDQGHGPRAWLFQIVLRVVSDAIASKGKLESFLCGKIGSGEGLAAVRARVTRLHRDESTKNAEWKRLRRGDLIVLHPAPDRERHRVGPETSVSISSEDIELR